jgi:[glutamine synthetase] adenylyltransferase / [glutamine synthetase]-adenylyl-L-tyrosine phosphorylase
MVPQALGEVVERSADPEAVRLALVRFGDGLVERLAADPDGLGAHTIRVVAASRSLTRVIETDPAALDLLDALDKRPAGPLGDGPAGDRPAPDGEDLPLVDRLVRWKDRELLRIAARDLAGIDTVEATTGALSDLAVDVLRAAVVVADAHDLAVVGMGKLGGHELNYASDIDLLFVGGEVRRARAVMDLARRCFRVDANLRPEGRDGPLTRSLDSYAAYWDRWAEPWEFQALLKAVPVAGDPAVGQAWADLAAGGVWGRPLGADDVRSLRALKERAEAAVARRGLEERDVKRGRGGIRDIEFSVQLLQLVHGRVDAELRSPTTLTALGDLAAGGYVDRSDAEVLAGAYRFLRRTEHALQLEEGHQTHTLPAARESRRRLARVLGYRGTPAAGPTEAFDRELQRQRNLVRSAHERLYFRPLLGALAGASALSPETAASALASFGFADAERTRQAVLELTRGLTRSSRMMRQLLPLLLDWLSETPDPDLGLLGLRKLASGSQRVMELANAFRDSPEVARHLCVLLGTSGLLSDLLVANPDLIVRLADPARLRTQARADLVASAGRALGWRTDPGERQWALRRWRGRHLLGVAARDVYGATPVAAVGADLTALAEATVEQALATLGPKLPFAVVALGRFAGGELSYASDLDVVFVHDGATPADHDEGLRLAAGLLRFVRGATPAHRIYAVDPNLRPEGRDGPLSRSLEGYAAYFSRWADVWERQAMARARFVAGDRELGARFVALVDSAVWERPFTADDEREIRRMKARVERERIPPGEDPQFHLKLGRGSLSDVEWTVQRLQLRAGVRSPGTMAALGLLERDGVVTAGDADVLRAAYRFCEQTRNRWWLVGSDPPAPDALPQRREDLARLARSLGTTPATLRDDYRRVTRRARRVVERLFYDNS